MEKSLADWVERLRPLALPAMPATRRRVIQLLDSPNTTHADLQRIIARDPGFSLAIFRLFGTLPQPPREPVTNLAHAIALLGIGTTSEAGRALSDAARLADVARTALYDCYSRAGHAAWYAYSWGHDLRLGNPEEMSIAALLHELGGMLLWNCAAPQMTHVTRLVRQGAPRPRAEAEVFGFELTQLSLRLAEQWHLPPLTAQALQPAGAFQTRSLAVMLAAALARESHHGWQGEQTGELIELAADLNRLETDPGRAYIHGLAAGAARNLSGLPLHLTAYALLTPSPPAAPPPDPEVAEVPVESPPGPATIDADTVPLERRTRVQPDAPLPATATRPQSPPAAEIGPLQASLTRIFRELRQTAGVERAMFAMLSPDRKVLKVKYIVGAEPDSPLRRFRHPLGERQLLTLLLKKNQSIWLRDSSREKLLPLMSEPLRASFDTRGFYLGSLFVGNRPIGILYADRTDGIPLDNHGFNNFKSLSQRLCNELSRKTQSNGSASLS